MGVFEFDKFAKGTMVSGLNGGGERMQHCLQQLFQPPY